MAETNKCSQCGTPVPANATECPYCGEAIVRAQPQPQAQQAFYQQNVYQAAPNDGINPAWPIKSKIVAGVLAILVGSLGIHKFYLGKTGMGVLYLLFCWTGIPGLVAFIEGIIYLVSNDHNFQVKNHVRLQ